jgi:hypothetical protein
MKIFATRKLALCVRRPLRLCPLRLCVKAIAQENPSHHEISEPREPEFAFAYFAYFAVNSFFTYALQSVRIPPSHSHRNGIAEVVP